MHMDPRHSKKSMLSFQRSTSVLSVASWRVISFDFDQGWYPNGTLGHSWGKWFVIPPSHMVIIGFDPSPNSVYVLVYMETAFWYNCKWTYIDYREFCRDIFMENASKSCSVKLGFTSPASFIGRVTPKGWITLKNGTASALSIIVADTPLLI